MLRGRTDCIAYGADAACDCAFGTPSQRRRSSPAGRYVLRVERLSLALVEFPAAEPERALRFGALPWSAAAKQRVRSGSLGPPFRRLAPPSRTWFWGVLFRAFTSR
jgi:hypothetical protein